MHIVIAICSQNSVICFVKATTANEALRLATRAGVELPKRPSFVGYTKVTAEIVCGRRKFKEGVAVVDQVALNKAVKSALKSANAKMGGR